MSFNHMNRVTLIGNLGQDPEVRTTNNGKQMVSLSLATSESWKDKSSGERKNVTEWHRVVVWNEHLVKTVTDYCKKGDTVFVEGQLKTRKWTDQSGNDKYTTEIVLQGFNCTLKTFPPKKGSGGDSLSNVGHQNDDAGEDLDDEIPF